MLTRTRRTVLINIINFLFGRGAASLHSNQSQYYNIELCVFRIMLKFLFHSLNELLTSVLLVLFKMLQLHFRLDLSLLMVLNSSASSSWVHSNFTETFRFGHVFSLWKSSSKFIRRTYELLFGVSCFLVFVSIFNRFWYYCRRGKVELNVRRKKDKQKP